MTEYIVHMKLHIRGVVDSENDEDAGMKAREIVQGGLADAGWSSDEENLEENLEGHQVELNGVMHVIPVTLPALLESWAFRGTVPCRKVSPGGRFRCTLPIGHELKQHVTSGLGTTLAIWS